MRVLNFGEPIDQSIEGRLSWAEQALRTTALASNEDIETVVFDGYSVSGDFTDTRALDASAAAAPVDSSGGTPATDLALVTLPDLSAWNGSVDPTAAQATAINDAFSAVINNISTLSAALATAKSENADLRSLIATLITDLRQRGPTRQE